MSGYNYSLGKSNRAVWAEENYRYNATQLAWALKCSTLAVKDLLYSYEWHHTSKWYNKTEYYFEPFLLFAAGAIREEAFKDLICNLGFYESDTDVEIKEKKEQRLDEAKILLKKLREYNKNPQRQTWQNCKVQWLEWGGTRRRPKCIECKEEGCTVDFNGKSTYKITKPDGTTFIKRKGTNGFDFFPHNEDTIK